MRVLSPPQSFGVFRLFAHLGYGGMAEVFLASTQRKELNGQPVALKRLLPHLNNNKAFINLLIHEAKIGVLLNHPNIVSVYDLGSVQSEFFMAMEYVHGKSLDQLLEKLTKFKQNHLSLELASYITMEIIRALAFAHDLQDNKSRELNIIHRDVSPGNILLSYTGDVKLSDFGIATAEHRLQPIMTRNALGKIAYIPPEQAINDPAQRSSDLYSLAAVYFQMLTGNLPFDFKSLDDLVRGPADYAILSDHLSQRGKKIPAKLFEFLCRCLQRNPNDRPQTAAEFFHVLKEILLEELQTDFLTRSTRNYFKKKMATFLQAAFKSEFADERNILIETLESSSQEVPIILSRAEPAPTFNPATEATELDRDVGTEPTSISGPVHRDLLAKSNNQDFFPVEDSRLKLEDKLRISSLSRDQRENLANIKPSLEILSPDQQDAFEAKTLGGPTTKAAALDHAKPREKEPAPGRTFHHQNTKPSEGDAKAHEKNTALVDIEKFRQSAITAIKKFSWKAARFLWLPALAFAMAFGIWFLIESNQIHWFDSKPSLLPTQKIGIFSYGETSPESMDRFLQNLRGLDRTLSSSIVESFFNREFQRYSKTPQKVMEILWNPPVSSAKKIVQTGFLTAATISKQPVEKILESIGAPMGETNKITLYFSNYEGEGSMMLSFRSKSKSLIVIPNHPSFIGKATIEITRELARQFGAKDKLDPETGMPQFPEGYARPDAKPVFPQYLAELMGEKIPIGPLRTRDPSSLNEIMIGPETADELGWATK